MKSRFRPQDPDAIHRRFERIKARALKRAQETDGAGTATRTWQRGYDVAVSVDRRRRANES